MTAPANDDFEDALLIEGCIGRTGSITIDDATIEVGTDEPTYDWVEYDFGPNAGTVPLDNTGLAIESGDYLLMVWNAHIDEQFGLGSWTNVAGATWSNPGSPGGIGYSGVGDAGQFAMYSYGLVRVESDFADGDLVQTAFSFAGVAGTGFAGHAYLIRIRGVDYTATDSSIFSDHLHFDGDSGDGATSINVVASTPEADSNFLRVMFALASTFTDSATTITDNSSNIVDFDTNEESESYVGVTNGGRDPRTHIAIGFLQSGDTDADLTFSDAGVNPAPPPGNSDLFVDVIDFQPGPVIEPVGSDLTNDINQSVWFRWVAPAAGSVTFDTHQGTASDGNEDPNGALDTTLTVWTGTALDDLVEVASNDDVDFDNDHWWSQVDFVASEGTTYWIQVGTFDTPYVGEMILDWSGECSGSVRDSVIIDQLLTGVTA